MNDSATSLDRLHDIVVPESVPFWPPAPGWYVVIALAVCLAILTGYRLWNRWRANAYRREALCELRDASSAAAISELLRRTALVIAPREVIARQTGSDWPDWLAARCPEPMPETVRHQLVSDVYRSHSAETEVPQLREYAAHWISHHTVSTQDS